MTLHETNWSGHVQFRATRVERPTSLVELQEIVRTARKVKVVGARHSFNAIADSDEALLSLENLRHDLVFDHATGEVKVPAGITYGELCPQLDAAGLALYNMASLPHITVAGAISTATHGSGDGQGILAAAVTALDVVTADGDVVEFSRARTPSEFAGAVVGLGGLGVVVSVTLATQPAFAMQQEVYQGLPLEQVYAHFDAITSSAYSVSLFPDWRTDRVNQVWRKHRLDDGVARPVAPTFYDATAATVHLRPAGGPSENLCTAQGGQIGPWYARMPHFRIDASLVGDDELQTEYFVPRRHAVEAIRAVADLGPRLATALKISEVRTMAGDDLWMSVAYGDDKVGIHFSWYRRWPVVRELLPVIEERLAPYQARPHWGKLFTMSPARVQSLYPRLNDFRALLRTYDPAGKFRNAYLDEYVFE